MIVPVVMAVIVVVPMVMAVIVIVLVVMAVVVPMGLRVIAPVFLPMVVLVVMTVVGAMRAVMRLSVRRVVTVFVVMRVRVIMAVVMPMPMLVVMPVSVVVRMPLPAVEPMEDGIEIGDRYLVGRGQRAGRRADAPGRGFNVGRGDAIAHQRHAFDRIGLQDAAGEGQLRGHGRELRWVGVEVACARGASQRPLSGRVHGQPGNGRGAGRRAGAF